MTNDVFSCAKVAPFFETVRRTALDAVRQWPISKRFAIHGQTIVVSARKRPAMRAFRTSPFLRRFNSRSVQPASRNISPTNRCAFCSSDSFNSSP